jgi:multidrug resistance protein, MATE family
MQNIPTKEALRQILIFSLPIIFGQIGLMLIGTGDMIVAGRYSIECLAAIGLAVAVANPIMISALGLQFSIAPILAQKRGRGEDIKDTFWTIIVYSLIVSGASCVLTLLSTQLVPLFKYDEKLNVIIINYLIITSFSAFGLGIYQAVKEFFQSQEKTVSANVVALIGAGINIFLNFAFVFGMFGFPELKENGLAWASLTIRLLMAFGLFAFTYKFWKTSWKMDWVLMRSLAKLGLPITLMFFLEIMAFCSVTLFVGKFDEIQVAANNLALNVGSLAFMIPLSISSAVAVKVGHAYGEKNYPNLLTFSRVSLFTSFCCTLVVGSLLYLFSHAVAAFYTHDLPVIEWAKKLIFWVACFQLFDGTQVTLGGILRGLSVTRPASISIFIGYWLIGIPLGYYLAFHSGLEAQGFWIGLAISLALVALMLGMVLKKKLKDLGIVT